MPPRPLPEIAGLKPAVHGGAASPDLIDFSTGVSPLPPPSSILAAIRNADVTRYPSPDALPLREAIAHHHGIEPSQVVAGSGSSELIWAIARSFVGRDGTALILAPTFGEYEQAVRAVGGRVETVVSEAPTFQWNLDQVAAKVESLRPSVVFACRPNNPTLSLFPLEPWLQLIRSAPETLFVVDEAYLSMFGGEGVPGAPNVVRLRSLTKVFALPGLRVGYLLADAPVATAVRASLPPWNLSSPAIAGGIAAMTELHAVGVVRDSITKLRQRMLSGLQDVGAHIDAAGGPFVLCDVGDAQDFCRRLDAHRIRLRDCTSFGLPAHVRVGVRDEAAQDVLLQAWRIAASSTGARFPDRI